MRLRTLFLGFLVLAAGIVLASLYHRSAGVRLAPSSPLPEAVLSSTPVPTLVTVVPGREVLP